MTDSFQLDLVEKRLNVEFQKKELLQQAFTHRSFWNENPGLKREHNERLKFLGGLGSRSFSG